MYDAIVIGTGGIGSAAMFHLASRGANVLGIDRFPPGHDRGSSHGESRIIRRSYFEHPSYVPLLNTAYDLWQDLCQRSGEQLYHQTGLVCQGSPTGPVIQGIRQAAAFHQLEIDELSSAEALQRFPGIIPPESSATLFESDAGYLLVEACVRAHIAESIRLGAEHRTGEAVVGWQAVNRGVRVRTNKAEYHADRLVITGGAWATDLLNELQIPLRVVRKHLHWYKPQNTLCNPDDGFPCFFLEALDGYFYGFPDRSPFGVKVAEHSGGAPVADPLNDDRQPEPADNERIQRFLKQHMPSVSPEQTRHRVCFYTLTPDEHFVVDRHPIYNAVVFAAGLSGHGFKFAPVLGKTLAELALDGRSSHDISFLSLKRESLKPN